MCVCAVLLVHKIGELSISKQSCTSQRKAVHFFWHNDEALALSINDDDACLTVYSALVLDSII